MQIIVLGMHRSGTSTLARILNLMGCYFGSEDVSIGASADNPKGFWERSDVIEINDYILRAAGGSWWDVASLDFGGIGAEDLAWIRKRIHATVIKLDANRPWFIKDPRLCLTLDFWLPSLECPVFIYAQRSPVQIAKSLEHRNGIPLEYGLGLWEFYVRSALRALGPRAYIPVAYDELLVDPAAAVARLGAALADAGVHGLRMPAQNELEAFVNPALCHFSEEDDASLLAPAQSNLLAAIRSNSTSSHAAIERMDLLQILKNMKDTGEWARALTEPRVQETIDQILEKQRARIDELMAINAAVESRNHELERGLRNLTQSRIVRTAGSVYRLLSIEKHGLLAELRRIDRLLNRSGNASLPVKRRRSVLAVVRMMVANPTKVLRLLHPRRIRNGVVFLLTNQGGIRKLYARFVDFHLQGYELDDAVYQEHIAALIDHYGLPRKSTDTRPPPPSDEEVDVWSSEIRRFSTMLAVTESPTISVVIPVFNQIRFTLACVHSILLNTDRHDYEIIIADDGSDDQTRAVFSADVPRLRYLRNETNLGFLGNCNNAATAARGRYIVFLNNDIIVLPQWLDELVRTFDENPSVGLVGSKLIYPEGRLQEAGGIIFQDGAGWNYGRFQDAGAREYNYMRDVDYCSGASLALPRALWEQLGGFDSRFSPAYYEDTDLAFQVRAAGRRVVYQPRSQVIHFEGISHGTSTDAGIKKHQADNREVFRAKWSDVLHDHGSCDPSALPADRVSKGRILVVDATTPTPDRDSGSLDTFNFLRIFKECGFHVTFLPQDMVKVAGYTEDLERLGIECSYQPWSKSLHDAILLYAPRADIVVLHRVYVASALVDHVRTCAPNAKIIFDTVDLHFLREAREADLLGCSRRQSLARKTRDIELEVIKKADFTLVRSEYEVDVIREHLPDAMVHVMPIVRDVPGRAATAWADRKDIVFIGGFSHPPNVDAVKYFVAEVWPLLRSANFEGKFIVAGSNVPDELRSLASDDIVVLGFVHDLAGLFASCRVSVAPLRYGAGLKGKVISSLSYGVPCVATTVATEGAGFIDGVHLRVEDDPAAMAQAIQAVYHDEATWDSLSKAGIAFCRERFSFDVSKRKWCELIIEAGY